MTEERLDRIEALIEALGHRVDSNARAIAANSSQIAEVDRTLSEAVGRTLRAVDELRERAEEDRANFREHIERTDTAIAGINATLAVLQQLMRDRNANGDQPQS
jgi:chromosome segregation ATPase